MHDLWWPVIVMFIMIIICFSDIKEKRIPIWCMAAIFISSVLLIAQDGEWNWLGIMFSCLPGVFLIIVAWLTEGKVGLGDGLLVLFLGIGMGLERCAYMMTLALVLCCIVSILLLVFHKVNRKTQIPFAPFLTVSLGVVSYVFG